MIGLTEEEIWDLIGESKTTYSEDLCIIANAQLKKVVDYLDTLEFYDDWGGESGKMLRDSIKQALLEEVKE